uniref:Uncharacterized protein n=1 Tax=Anguilla anguilla TaxID=7936 RepID=A0A0E9VSP0_ANGAN
MKTRTDKAFIAHLCQNASSSDCTVNNMPAVNTSRFTLFVHCLKVCLPFL